MDLKIRRFLFIISLICPYILLFVIIMNSYQGDILNSSIRLSGLIGFLSLSLGVIMNLLKKEIKSILGQPFITIHHVFVLSGLVLITIHPLLIAISFADFSVFIPDTSSAYVFLMNGGRFAILLIYLGFFAAVFRSVLRGRWVLIHRIIYLALILGIIHANLLGEDLYYPLIQILLDALAGIVIITGIIKLRFRHRLGKKR